MTSRLGPYELNTIVTGDARELAEAIPDNSVDLIFTDPPYPKEYLYLYEWVAIEAARILKPGGSLFALGGGNWILQVTDLMRAHLNYHWMCCVYHPTVTNSYRSFYKRLDNYWKPLHWLVKGNYTGPFLADGVNTSKPDKNTHIWGQDEKYAVQFLERFPKDTIVFDPFIGGGTTAAACKYLRLPYLGFEIEPAVAEQARQRVLLTQPPLFVMPELEQLELLSLQDD